MSTSVESTSDQESSEFSLSSSDSDSNGAAVYITPRKKRYKKSIQHGFSKRRALYHLSDKINNDAGVITNSTSAELLSNDIGSLEDFYEISSVNSSSATTISDSSPTCISDTTATDGEWSHSESDSSYISNSSSANLDSEQEQTENNSDDRQPLYEGCRQTSLSSYTTIMLFVMKHSLSKEAFADLLLLIETHLPEKTKFCKSIYKLKAFLNKHMDMKTAKTHNFCENCNQIVIGDRCTSEICQRKSSKVLQFHDLHLEHQIRELFHDRHFCDMITESNKRTGNGEMMSDIQDGLCYKKLMEDTSASTDQALHITFTLNTDGVALYSSSKKGNLWPIYIAINEIPVKLRFSKKYILPSYLYCQAEKPNMLTYMQPQMETLKQLSNEGIIVMTPYGRQLVKAHLLVVTVDLPARAMVSNMKQFNGKYGCSFCLDEGESRPNCPMHRYWPYADDNVIRSHKSFTDNAKAAVTSKQAVNGVKGACPLMVLPYVDIPKIFTIDWMHCVLLGVTKSLLKLWLSNEHRGELFYIGNKTALLNQRLQRIEIPDFIPRRQRGLEDYAHWKATECREWLLHFSVAVLEGVQNSLVHVHYMLLTTAMFLLNKDTVTGTEIDYAELLLSDFCRLFPEIYGDFQQTMNVHMLRHVPQFVRMYGPLFNSSCFGFESMNSYLKSMVHGTRHVNSQLSLAVGLTKALPRLLKTLDAMHGDLKVLADRLSTRLTRSGGSNEGGISLVMLGKKQTVHLTDAERSTAQSVIHHSVAAKYLRMQKGNEVFYSQDYSRTKTRNSYTVLLETGQYAVIHYYILADSVPMAMVESLQQQPCSLDSIIETVENETLQKYQQLTLNHQLKQVKLDNVKKLVPAASIKTKCILMKIAKSRTYISVPPNLVEHS